MNNGERFTLEELEACVKREVTQRKRVYGRLVGEGKMNVGIAAREIAMMEAIGENLERQRQPRLL